MPRKPAIPVPVGGGVNREPDEALVSPPFSHTVENMVVRKAGAYQKMPGSDNHGLSSFNEGCLVSHPNQALLLLGREDTWYRGASATWKAAASFSRHFPVRVTANPVMTFAGETTMPAIAHNGGYTCLAIRHMEKLRSSGTPGFAGVVGAVETKVILLNADGLIVGGPWTVADIDNYPRIEPISISGNPGFVLFGLQGALDTAAGPWDLRIAQISAVSPPATITTASLGTVTQPGVNMTAYRGGIAGANNSTARILYDTHGHASSSYAYVSFYDGTNVLVRRTEGLTLVSGAIVVPGAATTKHAVWYDHETQTVLVAHGSTTIAYAAPALGGGAFTDVGGSVSTDHPIWYKDDDGDLFMDGQRVTLTGSNPATPSFSGARAHAVPGKTYDPQPFPLTTIEVLFFNHESAGNSTISATPTTETPVEQSWLDAVVPLGTGGSELSYTLVPLMQTRHLAALWSGLYSPAFAGAGFSYFVQPQSCVDSSGRVLVPFIARIPTDRFGNHSAVTFGSSSPNGGTIWEGYQVNHDRVFGYLILDGEPPAIVERSFISHQNSLVVAAGNVQAWDGRCTFDFLNPPRLTDYDDSAHAKSAPSRESVGESESRGIHQAPADVYTHIEWWSARAVLVFTDRNGLEWRSAPSNSLAQDSIDGPLARVCPWVTLELDDSHRRILTNGGSLDVEWYVTQRDDGLSGNAATTVGAAAEADIVHEYYLAQRTPLDLQSGIYGFPDLLQSSFQGGAVTNGVSLPLYTDLQELAPVRPPASQVLCSAGGYLFLIPSEFPYELWVSKPLERGRGPEFAPELVLAAPSGSGGMVSLAAQGDRLIVLCRNGVYELFLGSGGPDANGGGGFGGFRLLHEGDGAVNHAATVETPHGVFYWSRSGPKMVRGDGAVVDLGRVIDGQHNASGVYEGVYHASAEEVWWFQDTSSGAYPATLIFNVKQTAWSSSSAIFRSAVFHDGAFYRHLVPTVGTGTIDKEDVAESKLLGSQVILGQVVSPWLNFGVPTGFKRVRRVGILGRYTSGTTGLVTVRLAYDYIDEDIDEFSFQVSDILAMSKGFNLVVKPSRQKFESIRITVEEELRDSDSTLIWSLISYELEVEAKGGVIKLQQEAKK